MISEREKASSIRGVALTMGSLAGVAGFCFVAAKTESDALALILCAPLFLGALAAICVPARPILAASLSIPLATAIVVASTHTDPGWIVVGLPFLIVWALPTAILGAVGATTIRRGRCGVAVTAQPAPLFPVEADRRNK